MIINKKILIFFLTLVPFVLSAFSDYKKLEKPLAKRPSIEHSHTVMLPLNRDPLLAGEGENNLMNVTSGVSQRSDIADGSRTVSASSRASEPRFHVEVRDNMKLKRCQLIKEKISAFISRNVGYITLTMGAYLIVEEILQSYYDTWSVSSNDVADSVIRLGLAAVGISTGAVLLWKKFKRRCCETDLIRFAQIDDALLSLNSEIEEDV